MNAKRAEIIKELKKNLFYIDRWPHYQLLFDHLEKVIEKLDSKSKIAILERCYIYNGLSIFSSVFEGYEVDVFDFIPPGSLDNKRHCYQFDKLKSMPLVGQNIKEANYTFNYDISNEQLASFGYYDIIFIPNVLHHHPDPFKLFEDCYNLLKPKGKIYIFDAILRESHQKPDDYIRFTDSGINFALKKIGFEVTELLKSSSPVESLFYTLDQVIQYDLPDDLLKDSIQLYDLIKTKYKKTLFENYENRIRKNTEFPIAYSVLAKRD